MRNSLGARLHCGARHVQAAGGEEGLHLGFADSAVVKGVGDQLGSR